MSETEAPSALPGSAMPGSAWPEKNHSVGAAATVHAPAQQDISPNGQIETLTHAAFRPLDGTGQIKLPSNKKRLARSATLTLPLTFTRTLDLRL